MQNGVQVDPTVIKLFWQILLGLLAVIIFLLSAGYILLKKEVTKIIDAVERVPEAEWFDKIGVAADTVSIIYERSNHHDEAIKELKRRIEKLESK